MKVQNASEQGEGEAGKESGAREHGQFSRKRGGIDGRRSEPVSVCGGGVKSVKVCFYKYRQAKRGACMPARVCTQMYEAVCVLSFSLSEDSVERSPEKKTKNARICCTICKMSRIIFNQIFSAVYASGFEAVRAWLHKDDFRLTEVLGNI